MNEGNGHTDKMCLIRQATNRLRARKEAMVKEEAKPSPILEPCMVCAGTINHYYPCTNMLDIRKGGKDILNGSTE